MIRSRLIGLAALATVISAEAQYYPQVYFKGSKDFLIADSGVVYRSDNGGSTWQARKILDSGSVQAIHFPTDQVGYMVGVATLLKTTDGGETWTRPSKVHEWLTQVAFLDEQTGIAVGVAGQLSTSTGGVETFSSVETTPTGVMTFNDVAYPAVDGDIMVGLDGWIHKDGSRVESPVTEDLKAVYFPTAAVGYVVGDSGTIIKTVDAGTTWSTQTSGTDLDLKDVYFRDAQNGWAVGGSLFSSIMLYTNDGGATWKQRTQPAEYQLSSICFADASRGFATGKVGGFLMTSDGGLTWSRITPTGIRGEAARNRGLRREADRMEYHLAAPGRVEARLFDASGRTASVLFAGRQAAGDHSLRLPLSGLPAGGYILDFRAAGLRQAVPLRGK